MNARDKAILTDLERFRCMSREDITDIHFAGMSTAVDRTNVVMKRLVRDGHVKVSRERRMYIYFPSENHIRLDSQKINHYLAIVRFFRDIRKVRQPELFRPEPKFGKGFAEPDVEMVWFNTPWFVEIQRNAFSKESSFERYEKYYLSQQWHELSWQTDPPVFPYVWIYGVGNYNTEKKRAIQVFHSDIPDLVTRLERKQKESR